MTDEQYKQLYVPLKEHFDSRLVAMDKAVEESRRLMEARMDGFPSQFVRKGDIDASMAEMRIQLCDLLDFKSKADGLASQRSLVIVWWVSFASFALAVIGIVLRFYGV